METLILKQDERARQNNQPGIVSRQRMGRPDVGFRIRTKPDRADRCPAGEKVHVEGRELQGLNALLVNLLAGEKRKRAITPAVSAPACESAYLVLSR